MSGRAALWLILTPGLVPLAGCGEGTTVTRTDTPPTLTVSQVAAVVPVNATLTLTSQVTGNTYGPPSWTIFSQSGGPVNAGSLNTSAGASVVYTAAAVPPTYSRVQPEMQGKVYLQGSVNGPFGSANSTTVVTVTAPTISTGIDPASASVPLGGSVLFLGYAVGSTNNSVVYQVNGVAGGSAATGYISNSAGSAGTYTAPSTLPMTGNTVLVSAVAQADATRSASAVVTLR